MITFLALNFQSFQNNYFSVHINIAYQQVHKLGSGLTFFATPCMLFNIF